MRPLPWLAPLVPLYSAVVRGKNAAYARGLFTAQQLHRPVISVGNLSSGGSGKTPVVIALAQLLMANGIAVDVLSRGYGRKGEETLAVPHSDAAGAELYGDEPLMIARATGALVFVGRSRFAAGELAEQTNPDARVHLLDDGFQHRQLARDLDIVVLHASDVSGLLLPAGHLREPLSSLNRAHSVVVREEDRAVLSVVQNYLRSDAQVWMIRRTLTCDAKAGPAVAFCGIARPEEFFAGLRSLGVEVAATRSFPDHHRFSDSDVGSLLLTCEKVKATRLITTEKDAVRMGADGVARLNGMPLSIAKLETVFLDPGAVMTTVRGLLKTEQSAR